MTCRYPFTSFTKSEAVGCDSRFMGRDFYNESVQKIAPHRDDLVTWSIYSISTTTQTSAASLINFVAQAEPVQKTKESRVEFAAKFVVRRDDRLHRNSDGLCIMVFLIFLVSNHYNGIILRDYGQGGTSGLFSRLRNL
jgi:hypothetical protein